MYPSICLACDPDPRRAQRAVSRMLAELNAANRPGVVAACAPGWAAAVVPPPAAEPTSGADLYSDGRDLLLWTGEILIPESAAHTDWAGPGTCGTGVSPVCEHQVGPARPLTIRLLALLQQQGIDRLARLDGAFAGAWFDAAHRCWHVFNDRFGLLPLFWSAGAGRLHAGPRAAVTAFASDDPPQIDPLGVAGLLRTQNMIDDHTLIAGVHWLQRGHALTWDGSSVKLQIYADFAQADDLLHDPQAAADAYLETLRSCLRTQAATTAPLLLGISGGLDSRLFLAVLHEMDRRPDCFSAGLPFASDVRFGRRLARVAGAGHAWLPLAASALPAQLAEAVVATDGLHNVGHLPPAAAIRSCLRRHTGAVLLEGYFNGVAGGATIPSDDCDDRRPAHEQPWAARLLHSGGSFALLEALLKPALARQSADLWRENIDAAYREAAATDRLSKAEYTIQSARRSRMDALGTALLREDVLVRNPAAAAAMVRWFQSVPPSLRQARRLFLDVLRRYYPRFARVPRSDTGGMPIAEDRWLREYHWQRERLYRCCAGLRYSALRRWGCDGNAIRAWTCATLLRQGAFDQLLDSDARILEWVRHGAVLDLYRQASTDPLQGMPLLGLWTIETMVRRLETGPRLANPPAVRFHDLGAAPTETSPASRREPAEVH